MRRHLRQRAPGFVLMAVLTALLTLTLGLLAAWSLRLGNEGEARQTARRAALLADASRRVSRWYQEHLAELDSAGLLPPDPAAVLPPQVDGLRAMAVLGELQAEQGIFARRVIVRVTAPGPVAPATLQTEVDGAPLEHAALDRARRQLQEVASRLEIWYRARVADDPLHRVDRNHFQPQDPACRVAPGELPCLPEYAEVATLPAWRQALALDAEALRTPWGMCCPLEASTGPLTQEAPFAVALRIRTPWGATLQAAAVAPGG